MTQTLDPKPYRIIIAGSRHLEFSDFDPLLSNIIYRINRYVRNCHHIEVVSGTARGGDQLGENWAKVYGHQIARFPAYWKAEGRAAGYNRNMRMAKYADALIAIWDGKSRGTMHMIDIAKDLNLDVRIIRTDKISTTELEVA